MRSGLVVKSLLVVALGAKAVAPAAGTAYTVDAGKSAVRIHVGKSGAFSFAGHRHEVEAPVSGTVMADAASLSSSSVVLAFATARMRVLPDGEPAGDAAKVEDVMQGPKVLDAARFPEIHFRSKTVSGQAVPGGGYDLRIVGELDFHGVAREITVPVKVTVDGRTLTAAGHATLRHDQLGMTPVSAGGGTVKVANELEIDLRIVAEQR
jgi:polyisoprenoid-binding protein YceI